MERSGGERRGGMLSDDASRKGRKIEVKIFSPPPRALLIPNARHVRVDGGMIVGGGDCALGGL